MRRAVAQEQKLKLNTLHLSTLAELCVKIGQDALSSSMEEVLQEHSQRNVDSMSMAVRTTVTTISMCTSSMSTAGMRRCSTQITSATEDARARRDQGRHVWHGTQQVIQLLLHTEALTEAITSVEIRMGKEIQYGATSQMPSGSTAIP